MSDLDRIVTTDLAALAADSRRQVPAVDNVLRELSRRRRRPERAAPAAELALLSFAKVFAHRVGRAAAGAMAIVYTGVLLVVLYGPIVDAERQRAWLLADDVISIAARGAVLTLVAYAIAVAMAGRWFERALGRSSARDAGLAAGDATGAAARLVRSVDGWSVGLAIAGATSIVTLIGVGTLVVGWDGWDRFWCFGCDPEEAIFRDRLHDLTAAIGCIVAAGLALGWVCTRPRGSAWGRAFEHRLVVPAGLVVGAAAVVAWVANGVDRGDLRPPGVADPASALRTALTVALALALFGVASGLVLRWRRREGERLEALPEAALVPDESARRLVGLAGVYRLRVARLTAGAVALMYAVALVVVLHDPFGGGRNHDFRAHWRDWFVFGRLSRGMLVALLMMTAHVVAAHLAGRAFERRLAARRAGEPVELARQLVMRVDGWSVALGIAGLSAVAGVFALLSISVGDSLWVFFLRPHGPRSGGALHQALHDVELVCVFVAASSLAIGRACACRSRRPRWLSWLEHPAALPTGVVLGVVTIMVGRGLDFGVFDISLPAVDRPSIGLQVALTAMCATAAVMIVGSYTVRRRRAEQERLGLPR